MIYSRLLLRIELQRSRWRERSHTTQACIIAHQHLNSMEQNTQLAKKKSCDETILTQSHTRTHVYAIFIICISSK